MNKERRKQITEIIEKLYCLKEDINCISDEESDCLESMPENLWGSARYEQMEIACESLSDAVSYLEDVIDCLECARDGK